MSSCANRYFDLSHFALIEISGKDAFVFLQGQITGDLKQLAEQGWLFSAWCLPNGRVICTFIVYSSGDSLFLILPAMLKNKIITRLSMFVLRSGVTIQDAGEDYALMGVCGTEIAALVKSVQAAGITALKLWGAIPRYIFISRMEKLPELLNQIMPVCAAGERSGWSLLDINTGMPWIINATTEIFLPQMLNIDQMNGLSYQKGCYPGQEIIARLRYRGELKKRLYLGTGRAGVMPGAGDRLELADSGTLTGEVIDAESGPAGGYTFLAVNDIGQAENPALSIKNAPASPVTLQALIYGTPGP